MLNDHRSNPPDHIAFHRFFLDLCVLGVGPYHHNIRGVGWNAVLARPLEKAARTFWNAWNKADPIIYTRDGDLIR